MFQNLFCQAFPIPRFSANRHTAQEASANIQEPNKNLVISSPQEKKDYLLKRSNTAEKALQNEASSGVCFLFTVKDGIL